ncbi:MAG: trypsin-like peptidase domain-containing protein [Leptospiraceae bacterium]|nr:trypsin-like peptidase domain-containing protein [Leptospiraceae bacterium]
MFYPRYRNTLIFVLISALTLSTALQARSDSAFPQAELPSPLAQKKDHASVRQMQGAFRDVFELYKDSVVFISTEKEVDVSNTPLRSDPLFKQFFNQAPQSGKQKQNGLGTGFILSSDGYICTNYHVVAQMDSVKVTINGEQRLARIIGSDELTDIALLKVDGVSGLKPVHLGDSDKVQVGDWAIAIGNPFGLDRTFTVGVVSSVSRNEIDQLGNSHIQTDASINPGNSGGPLINLDGEVIGVNRMIYSESGGNMGIGFAIPINTARAVLQQLREKGKVSHGYLGVNIRAGVRISPGPGFGVYVQSVTDDGPAKEAGIQPGDFILYVGDQKINEFSDLIRKVAAMAPGDKVAVKLWRKGKQLTVNVTLKQRPAQPGS